MPRHTNYDDLKWEDNLGGVQRASVTLDTYDTAWQPGSTKRVYHGPLAVTYTKFPNGGIDAVSFPRHDLRG